MSLLAEYIDRPAWMTDAACRHHDTNIWFPERGDDTRTAVTICETCPVLADCRTWALKPGNVGAVGIIGGMTRRTRLRIRKQRQETP